MLENAAVATFLAAPDGRLLYANRAFYDLLGYDETDPVGIGIDEIVHPHDAALAREQVRSMAAGKVDRYQGERRYVRKDGRSVWVLVSASALRDEKTGERRYTLVQAISIDKEKKAEAALAESESRWNFALESAGQGVWDHNLNRKTVFYSRMWRLMRGFEPDEEVDGSLDVWIQRVHPDDRERILAIVRRQDSGELHYNEFEYREQRRDGQWIWILSRGKPVAWNPDGTPARILGTDTDITALKRVESQLALEKERLKVTLEAIADGVISTDAAGLVTFMNPAAEQLTGWRSAEALGAPIEDVFAVLDEATGQPGASPVRECLKSGRLYVVDTDAVLASRDGRRRDLRNSAAPVRTPHGELIGAVLVFQDVTHSRALQRELAHTAMHDSLTGLPNRASFEQALRDVIEQAHREMREHALCFVDIDRFKAVNDSAGHGAGDALLQEIAGTIKGACRADDLAARIGGDEFALLLPDCSVAGAERVAQKVIAAIAAIRFTWGGATYEVGASVGVTAIDAKAKGPAELMSQADAACYVAKARGRNCVAIYDEKTSGLTQLRQSA